MRIVSLVGARPQIIKETMINRELKDRGIDEIIIHSGQHYDYNLSDVFFQSLDITKPHYNLGISSSKHGEMTGKMIIELEKILESIKLDMLFVYGDTNTTLAGAIVASKLKIPIVHIEAGIRQKPADMPEEINRTITDKISTVLFCTSSLGVENLKKEGILNNVYNVGDVMYDLFLEMKDSFRFDKYKQLLLSSEKYLVLTLHRDFNVDHIESLKGILNNIRKLCKEIPVVWPMHPRARRRIEEFGLGSYLEKVVIIDPLDYCELMGLVANSWKVITDSGGLQKEAYYCRKRAVVLMPDTGWRELINIKWNVLANQDNLYDIVMKESYSEYIPEIYGNGSASKQIVDVIEQLARF